MLSCGLNPKVPQNENLGLDATALKLLLTDSIAVKTRTTKNSPPGF